MISIHAPRGGSDIVQVLSPSYDGYFNPRSPWGERQLHLLSRNSLKEFQSTLPVGGATAKLRLAIQPTPISIHAPRGGSDCSASIRARRSFYFNPRSPWGERRGSGDRRRNDIRFQSTLPVGGATGPDVEVIWIGEFQSTLPVGGATATIQKLPVQITISIHAPRGGSDDTVTQHPQGISIFQSTLPVGGATIKTRIFANTYIFQSTLPVGGATRKAERVWKLMDISIHAPRGGSDCRGYGRNASTSQFQSTLPVGGATSAVVDLAPRSPNFNPRSPWGERRKALRSIARGRDFNPRSPWGERLHHGHRKR